MNIYYEYSNIIDFENYILIALAVACERLDWDVECDASPGPVRALDIGDMRMLNNITRFLKNEDGATAIEYGLIAALIGVVIIISVQALGTEVSATFGEVKDGLAKRND